MEYIIKGRRVMNNKKIMNFILSQYEEGNDSFRLTFCGKKYRIIDVAKGVEDFIISMKKEDKLVGYGIKQEDKTIFVDINVEEKVLELV
jgi:hypothetical protein